MNIRPAQLRLLEMAKSVHAILDAHGIPYMISYGTLLGAVRHHGFIPWDDDFDIFLFSETYDQAINVLSAELPNTYFVENEKSEPLYFHAWAHVKDLNSEAISQIFLQDNAYSHHGLFIDLYKATKMPREKITIFQYKEALNYFHRLFLFGLMSEEKYKQRVENTQKSLLLESGVINRPDDLVYGYISSNNRYFEVSEVFPLKWYQFENTYFWGPNSYDSILKRIYNNYMELPPINKRLPHYSMINVY